MLEELGHALGEQGMKKPIATAPRDGRLVRVLHGKAQTPVWARWNSRFQFWHEVGEDLALQGVLYWTDDDEWQGDHARQKWS